jgi:hypothetical protein
MIEPPRTHRPAIVNGNDEGLPPIEFESDFEFECITDEDYPEEIEE